MNKHIKLFENWLNESDSFNASLNEETQPSAITFFSAPEFNFVKFAELLDKVTLEEIMNIWNNPSKGPDVSSLKPIERATLIGMAMLVAKGTDAVDMNMKNMKNYVQFLINAKDRVIGVKGMQALQQIFPQVKGNDYWEEDMKGMFFDAYPELADQEQIGGYRKDMGM